MNATLVIDQKMPPEKSDARWATSALFLVDGIGFGVWAALLPSLQARLHLTHGLTSILLLGMVLGAFVAMPLTGKLIGRWGCPQVLRMVAPAYCAVLALPILSPSFMVAILAATLFGALKGALDVAVNSQAVAVEQALARPIMATFQALWSVGGLVAAVAVSVALRGGFPPTAIAVAVSAVLLALAARTVSKLIDDPRRAMAPSSGKFPLESPLLLLGLLAFFALFIEGVMMDWSAIYAHEVGGAASWLAPVAYGVFCCAMATGRFLGDGILTRNGAPRVLRRSGVAAGIGLCLMIAWPVWPVTFLGLTLAGMGLANLVPIYLSAAGRLNGHGVGHGVAAVSTLGYLGFLAGPPTVGGLSAWFGLRGALLFVVLFAVILGIAGPGMLSAANRPVEAK
ncbi:MAG: transporter [Pedosphaera sp.]|nr:transporter [Pedosphaera sp.]